MICDRCGWVVPHDCTCRHIGPVTAPRLEQVVELRHRESVARARAAGWAAAMTTAAAPVGTALRETA